MNAEDQDVFIAVLKTAEEALAQNWAMQEILDDLGVSNWRETVDRIVPAILPDIHARLRPLSDAIVGVPPLGPRDTHLAEWREEMQALIRNLIERGKEH